MELVMARSTFTLAVAALAGATASNHLPDNPDAILDRARAAVAKLDVAHLTRGITLDAIHGEDLPDPRGFGEYARRNLLAPDGRDTSLDPWGGRYEVQHGDGFAIVRSNGPDGRPGTADDIERYAPTMSFRLLFW